MVKKNLKINSFGIIKIFLVILPLISTSLIMGQDAGTVSILLSDNNNYGDIDGGTGLGRGCYNNSAAVGGIVVQISNSGGPNGGVNDEWLVGVQYHTGIASDGNAWVTQYIDVSLEDEIEVDGNASAVATISHAAIMASPAWPGTSFEGNVTWIVMNDDVNGGGGFSLADGQQTSKTFDFDMVNPTISLLSITVPKSAPWNQTNPHYAKVGDQIRLDFTASEKISLITGTVSGNSGITATGLNTVTPYITIDAVDNMEDGNINYTFLLLDLMGNSISVDQEDNTENTTAIKDFTPPDLGAGGNESYYVKMVTGDGDYYAKANDNVTLTISASETLVQGDFDGDGNNANNNDIMVFNIGTSSNYTVTPALSGTSGSNSSEFSATITLTNAVETSGTYVDYSVTGIYDRAGNETTITDDVPTDNKRVFYDSNAPDLENVYHVSTGDATQPNPYRVRSGQGVKLQVLASEDLDYNWDEGINTRPAVVFKGNNGTSGNSFNSTSITQVGGSSDLKNFYVELEDVAGLDEGTLTFSMSYRDLSYNDGAAYTALDNEGTRITIDNISPTIDALTIESSNTNDADDAWALLGDRVTITIDANEELRYLSQYDIANWNDGVTGTIGGISDVDVDRQSAQVWLLSAIMTDAHPVGEIEFAATITDMAGNTLNITQADITDGSTITYDQTKPVLSNVRIWAKNVNDDYPTWAKEGDVIYLQFEADEDLIADPTVTIAGGGATKHDQVSRTYTYKITADPAVHEENVLVTNPNANFTIDFINKAGNPGVQVTHLTAGVTGTVTIDYTPPTLTGVTISSDNSVTTYARSGSLVTLAFDGSDNLTAGLMRDDLTVQFDYDNGSGALETTENGDDTNKSWTAQAIVGTGVREQVMTFQVSGFKDLAGNTGTAVTAVDDGNTNVTYDETVPTISALSMSSNNANSDQLSKVSDRVSLAITVNSTVEPNGIQVPVVTIANRTSTDGDVTIMDATNTGNAAQGDLIFTANYTMQDSDTETDAITFRVDFKDLAGNEGVSLAALINDVGVSFDKTAPDFTNTIAGSSISMVSDNDHDTGLGTITDVMTLTLTSAEALKANTLPTVNILGVLATVTANNANTVFTATHAITGNETGINNNEVVNFLVAAGYSDATGNTGTVITQAAALFANATLRTTDGTYVLYDITPPTLSPVTISSSNDNSQLAVVGDVITLEMTSDTPLRTGVNPVFTIAGVTIDDSDANMSVTRMSSSWYKATYTMQDNNNDNAFDDPDLTIPLTISSFDDAAGNTGNAVTNTTDPANSKVTFDNTAPILTAVSFISDMDDPTLAIPGRTLTLTFTSDTPLQDSPTVLITGRPPDDNPSSSDNLTWTARIVMLNDDEDGQVPFTINYKDIAGNSGNQVTQANTTDGSLVNFDLTQPSLNDIYMRSECTDCKANDAGAILYARVGTVINISFKVTEQLSAIDLNIIGETDATGTTPYRGRYPSVGGDPVTITKLVDWTGVYEQWKASYELTSDWLDNGGAGYSIPFTIDYTDLNLYGGAQVSTTTDEKYVSFDKTAPLVETFLYSSNNSTSTLAKVDDDLTLDFTANELIQTPVMKIGANAVTEVVGATDKAWSAVWEMTSDDDEGQVAVELVSFTDYAGNAGAGRTTTTDGVYITFDQTPPSLQIVDVTSSNNYSSNLYAKAGDVITFTINTETGATAGELILEPTFTILGSTNDITVSPAVEGNLSSKVWTATRTVLGSDTEGQVAFSIAFTDRAGNNGVAVTGILSDTDNTNVIVDLTATDLLGSDPVNNPLIQLDLDTDSDTGVDDEDNLTNIQIPTLSTTGLTTLAVGAGTDSIYVVSSGTDTLVRSYVNANEMSFTIPDAKALANQLVPHQLTLVTKDKAGNISEPTNVLKVRVDTAAPALGNAMDLLEADDTGFLSNDDKTRVRTPKFEITPLEPNKKDELKVYYNTNELLVTHRMDWAVTDTVHVERVLNDGTYTFFYTVTDSAGNTSASSTNTTVVIDATNPGKPTLLDLVDASDSGTSNSDNLTNLTTLSFDIEGLTETDSVYIVNSSDVLLGQAIVPNAGKATITIGGLTPNTFTAYAKDLFGNQSLSTDGLAVVVDIDATTMTGVAVDLNADSDSGDSDSDDLTNDVTPSFTVTGLTLNDSLYLLVDGVRQDSVLATGTSHQFTVGRSDLADNIHSATILSVDYAGNQSIESPALAFTTDATSFTISNVPSLVAADDSGILSNDNITNEREPSFLFTDLSVDADHISLYVNDENVAIATGTKAVDVTEHSLTVPTLSKLSEGDFIFKYLVTDAAGNVSDTSGTMTISVDITAPSAPSSAPDLSSVNDSGNSDSDNLTNGTTTSIITNGLPVGDTRMLYKVNSLGTVALIDSQMVGGTGNLSYDDTNNESGVFTYHSVLLDVAGNASSSSSSLQVTIDQVAPNLTSSAIDLDPASDSGRSSTDDLTSDTTPTFNVSGLTVGDSIDLYFNGANPIRKYADATSLVFTATSTQITIDGNYQVSLKATDPAGNISTDVVTLNIVIDTTPENTLPLPDLLAADDSGRSSVDDTTSNRAPIFDLGNGIQSQYPTLALTGDDFYVRLYIVDGLDTILVEDNRMSENVFTHQIQIPHEDTNGDFIVNAEDYYLSDGNYSVIYTIEDDAGNVSDYSPGLDIVVDITATDVSTVVIDLDNLSDSGRDDSDDITNVSAPQFTLINVKETDIALLNIKDAGGTIIKTFQRTAATEANDLNDIDTVSFAAPLDPNDVTWGLTTDATYTITMQSVDQAGNTSAESSPLSIIYDATAPDVSSIAIDLQAGSDTGILNTDDLTNDTIPVFDISGMNSTNEAYNQRVILNIDWDCTDYNPINPYVFTQCTRTSDKTLSSLSTLNDDGMIFTLSDSIIDYAEPSGHYELSVTSIDIAGNISSNSTLTTFILDREPEINLSAPDLVNTSDAGFYDDDDITNVRDPFMYMGDPTLGNPNAITQEAFQIDLYALTGINNVLVNTATKASGTTDHSMQIPLDGTGNYQLTEGTHFIRYTITDDAGNVSDFSPALNILVDVTPPAAPPVPDLYFLDDLGESDSDDLTSPLNINRTNDPNFPNVDSKLDKSIRLLVDEEGNLSSMIPGYKWTINSWVDADGNGIIDNGEFTGQDSCLVPGGRFPFFHPINRAADDFNLPSPVGENVTLFDTLSVYDPGQPSTDYFFFSVQTDTAGNRSANSSVYQVTTDYDAPTCVITYEEAGLTSDLLVKSPDASIDAIFTFTKSVDDLSDLPIIDVDYPDLNGTIDPNLSTQDISLSKVGGDDKIWSGTVPFDGQALENHDGSIKIVPEIKDVYGNTVSTFTGDNDVVMDNTHPQFTDLTPLDGSFNNVLNNFGFQPSENLTSGTVTFTNSIGNIEWTAALANNTQNELNTGISVVNSSFENGPPVITEGIYTITLAGTDPAGNVGETLISNYTYDITIPTVEFSFSQLVASEGTTVAILGTFSEDMALTPQLLINTEGQNENWNNDSPYDMYSWGQCDCNDPVTGDPIDGCDETVSGKSLCEDIENGGTYVQGADESLWGYDYVVPASELLNGYVEFVVLATDKATNIVDSYLDPSNPDAYGQDGVGGTGLTYENNIKFEIDNTVSIATYYFENVTNPGLVNDEDYDAAKGGDQIQVYVVMNESISPNAPIPSLQVSYGSGNSYGSTIVEGFPFSAVDVQQDGTDDLTPATYDSFIFDVIIADSLLLLDSDGNPGTPMDTIPVDDGYAEFLLIGMDRANNAIQQHVDNDSFYVDNIHPEIFQTGNINSYGDNPVEGWLSGITDSIGIELPIPSSTEDFSLSFGGSIKFQIKNLTQGLFWRDIDLDLTDTQNPQGLGAAQISTTGPAIEYFRRYDEIIAALDADEGIQTGDQASVRAVLTDGYGNVRTGIPTHLMTNDNGIYTPVVLTYDIDAPVVGEIVYDEYTNFGDTIRSFDTVMVEWTAFIEQEEASESGLEYYELKIDRINMAEDTENGGVADGLLLDWFQITNLSDLKFAESFLLEHNHGYIASLRAYDFAGNISDVVTTEQLLRLNSAPAFEEHGNANLEEDIYWSTTVKFTDVDFNVLEGDTVTILAEVYIDDSDDATLANLSNPIVFDAEPAALTNEIGEPLDCNGNPIDLTLEEDPCYATTIEWIPEQSDIGLYELRVKGTDLYTLNSTLRIPFLVSAVNDTPLSSIPEDQTYTWEEDVTPDPFTLPIEDVDDDMLDLLISVVILHQSQLDEDFPFGYVAVGPNTPPEMKAKLSRQYLGFNPNTSAHSMSDLSSEKMQLMTQMREGDFITPTIYSDIAPDNSDTTWLVQFNSIEHYYGSDFLAKVNIEDTSGAFRLDTLYLDILAENDPPVINSELMFDRIEVIENDSIMLEFGQFVTDVDDTTLTFGLSVIVDEQMGNGGNDDKINIIPQVGDWTMDPDNIDDVSYITYGLGDSVKFIPEKLWSDSAIVKLAVSDGDASVEETFVLNVKHVNRPKLSVSVLQQTAFSKYMQVVLVDTESKTEEIEMKVQNVSVSLDTLAPYTYTGHMDFILPGQYSIDIAAFAHVGDTAFSRSFNIAAGRVADPWSGSSYDGLFSVTGDPGAILFDQPFLIADSTLFPNDFQDRGSYIFGSEEHEFNRPIEIRLKSDRSDLAIYRRNNNLNWVELPSLNDAGDIFTLSYESGYFRLGPKTIIVPEQTSIHQNYPNPFNPTTTILYDIGLLDGLRQSVSINVYNLLGQHVTTLVENRDQIGQFQIQWDGHDKFGQEMASGIYFVQLMTKTGIVRNKKMMLMK